MLYTFHAKKLLQSKHDTKMIIYMNIKTNNMKLELTIEEIMTILEGLMSAQETSCFMEDFTRYNTLEEKIKSLINK